MFFAKAVERVYAKAREDVRGEYERVLAILREELATKERQLAEQMERADLAADRLLAIYGARAISRPGLADYSAQVRSEANLSAAVNQDMFEDLPFTDPRGTYKSLEDAELAAPAKDTQ